LPIASIARVMLELLVKEGVKLVSSVTVFGIACLSSRSRKIKVTREKRE
jgi:hypothetical protein